MRNAPLPSRGRTFAYRRTHTPHARHHHHSSSYATAPTAAAAGQSIGYCALHHRKRMRSDLMPWHDQPGRSRCRGGKECRARDGQESVGALVLCRIHRKRRKSYQMIPVSAGVWECPAHASCTRFGVVGAAGGAGGGGGAYAGRGRRTRAASGASMPLRRAVGAGASALRRAGANAPGSGRRGGRVWLNAARASHTKRARDDAATASWAPVRAADATDRPRPPAARSLLPTSDGVAAVRGTARMPMDKKVWCARHGKLLLSSQCYSVDGFCYVCYDAGFCLSTPLDAAGELMGKGCAELLCVRHRTLRSVGFLERVDDDDGEDEAQRVEGGIVVSPVIRVAG